MDAEGDRADSMAADYSKHHQASRKELRSRPVQAHAYDETIAIYHIFIWFWHRRQLGRGRWGYSELFGGYPKTHMRACMHSCCRCEYWMWHIIFSFTYVCWNINNFVDAWVSLCVGSENGWYCCVDECVDELHTIRLLGCGHKTFPFNIQMAHGARVEKHLAMIPAFCTSMARPSFPCIPFGTVWCAVRACCSSKCAQMFCV